MKTLEKLTAKDIMNPDVVLVHDDMSVSELAATLTQHGISGAPVLDSDGLLVGVVSLSDIVANNGKRQDIQGGEHVGDFFLHGWEDELDETELRPFHVVEEDSLTVADILTPVIYKVDENTDIPSMADTMIQGRIHRLIVTRDQAVVGIVSTLDMLKAIRGLAD
ncbi:MAG: CBS domain-containing protein [Wenzhouxiangella sp.]